jgi:hypothetical protein
MPESVEASLVRIRTAEGRVVGAGFLVGERHVLTCAHVVVQALSLSDHSAETPQGGVLLDFPLIAPRTPLTASVVQWCPPSSDGRGDIAGLELQSDPPARTEVVRFAPAKNMWEHVFRAFGFPAGYDDGVWATGRLLGRQATGWVMIEGVKTQGFGVVPGFSGTPVWDVQAQGVVGMVVAASRPAETKAAFVIPLDVLVAAWPLITVPLGEPRNPYKGLRPFTQKDAGDFFGREPVVEKLVELIKPLVTKQPATVSKRLVTIIGPSGSGKSSLIMAGLLPQLQRGALPGSETWLYLKPMKPGKHPLTEELVLILAAQLPDRGLASIRQDLQDDAPRGLHQMVTHLLDLHLSNQPGTKVVLLVDQCEELFTQTESEEERQGFIELLLTACSEPRGPLLVLLTLRADFYDRPMRYPDLFHLIDTHHLPLLSIEASNLRRVIEQPAALPDVQLTFEGDLVNQLLSEVQGQVGALPLLQFTLDQLFQRRNGRQLSLSAYHEMGGVRGALSKHAEDTYAALSEQHRKLARVLFLRLIDPGMTEQDTTRRRATFSEFILDDPTQTRLLRETIDTFIAARLLTTNEIAGTTTIEVSHEALIREWPRLADWLHEAREDIRLQQTISKDAAAWEQHNKPRDRLYRGSQLKEAQAWARRNTPSGNEMAFLRAGTTYKVRSLVSVIAVLLIVVSSIGVASWVLTHPLHLMPPDPTRVINLQDNGVGSLRWAIANAPLGSTITFNASLRGIIRLTSGDLNIGRNLRIRGPGADMLSISSGKSGDIVRVVQSASVTISGLTFKDSTASKGFIDNEGVLKLSNSTISDNMATDPTSSGGGGIYNHGTLTLTNSAVSGNTALLGGGIANDGTLTLINSTVSGNTAIANGGGINNFGPLMLTNSTVSGNTGGNGGGIENGDMLTLTNSTVSGNTAQDNGGGIDNTDGVLTLTNSTVSGNSATAAQGGGIAITEDTTGGLSPPSVMVLYCTVYGNTADVGGGIWAGDLKQGRMTMGASIVAGNKAHTGHDIVGPLTTLGYNLVEDRSGVTSLGSSKRQSTDMLGVSSTDLKIDPVLRDNVGSTKTLTRTHALLPGSPAIDAIPLQDCQVKDILNSQFRMYTDQRGMKRPDENESACDIGAYEYVDSST